MNTNTKLKFNILGAFLGILFCALFFSCKPEPEFYINGKPFYTRLRCVKSKIETNWEYHYGYNTLTGRFESHYGPNTKTKCIQSIVDTIEIK